MHFSQITIVCIVSRNQFFGTTCTLQYGTLRYGTLRYGTTRHSTVQLSTVEYNRVEYNRVQYGAAYKRRLIVTIH